MTPNPTPSEASYGAVTPKTPEKISSEFEEKLDSMWRERSDGGGGLEVFSWTDFNNDLKSFLTESLAAYRLSLLSECENLVEDSPMDKGTSFSELGFNAANALWRERIKKMME